MTQAVKDGDTISVHYQGRLQSGKVFDASKQDKPLKFTVGTGMLIKGFDQAVVGMKPGEKKTVMIEPEMGYGERNEEMFVDVPKTAVPEDMNLVIGDMVQIPDKNGRPLPATVAEFTEDAVRMDLNHFLAGKTLEFDITIVETGLEPDAHQCGHGSCGDHSHGCDCGSDGCC